MSSKSVPRRYAYLNLRYRGQEPSVPLHHSLPRVIGFLGHLWEHLEHVTLRNQRPDAFKVARKEGFLELVEEL